MAKNTLTIENAKLFNLKDFGNGCRFGVNINSRNQDGSYSKGTFLNCKCREKLSSGQNYTIQGFLSDNEYNGNVTLEFIVMTASPQGIPTKPKFDPNKKPDIKIGGQPEIDIDPSEIPF